MSSRGRCCCVSCAPRTPHGPACSVLREGLMTVWTRKSPQRQDRGSLTEEGSADGPGSGGPGKGIPGRSTRRNNRAD